MEKYSNKLFQNHHWTDEYDEAKNILFIRNLRKTNTIFVLHKKYDY